MQGRVERKGKSGERMRGRENLEKGKRREGRKYERCWRQGRELSERRKKM